MCRGIMYKYFYIYEQYADIYDQNDDIYDN